MVSQDFWKNSGWKPSGPGAFKGFIEKMAFFTSTKEGGRQKLLAVIFIQGFIEEAGQEKDSEVNKLQ